MATVAYLSDTHVDFFVKSSNPLDKKIKTQISKYIQSLNPLPADFIIVAGDLGHYNTQNKEMLLQLSKKYKHVVFTTGNHDLYLTSRQQMSNHKNDSLSRVREMKEWADSLPNIHYLDGQVIELCGIKVAGLSMWYDYSYGIKNFNKTVGYMDYLWKETMNDSNYIAFGIQPTTYATAYGGKITLTHFDPLQHFASEKAKLDLIPANEVDVMVTHFGPCAVNIPPLYDDPTTGFYYFDGVEDLLRINPKVWVYGHTHNAFKHTLSNGTTLLCNPCGYPNENPYKQIEVFEVEKRA